MHQYVVGVPTNPPREKTDHSQLLRRARSQGGVVTRAQARELGYSWRRLDTMFKRGWIAPLLDQWVIQRRFIDQLQSHATHTAVAHAQIPHSASASTHSNWFPAHTAVAHARTPHLGSASTHASLSWLPTHTAVAHALMLRLGPEAIVTGAAAALCLGATGDWPERFGVALPMAYLPTNSHRVPLGATVLRSTTDGTVLARGMLRLADRTTALLDCIDVADENRREALMDHLLQMRWLTRDGVDARVSARSLDRSGRRATPAQVAARRQAADGTESVAERLLAQHLHDAGLRSGRKRGWIANHVVHLLDQQHATHLEAETMGIQNATNDSNTHASSRRAARLDFAWPDCQLAVEVDGRAHHSHDEAFEYDRARRNDLECAGWMVLNVTWKALSMTPRAVVSRIQAALALRRAQASRCVRRGGVRRVATRQGA